MPARPSLSSDLDCDVVIVGGGFTGLWTAYYLAQVDPGASIVVLERELVGFGASGRNGGWIGGGLAGSASVYAREHGWPATLAAVRETNAAVDEIGRVIEAEGIECHFRKQGSLAAATSAPQWSRLQEWYGLSRRRGIVEADELLLDPAAARELVSVEGLQGAFFTPHCATADPARLVRGLAETVERSGVRVLERSDVVEIADGRVLTSVGARVRAPVVIRATESYSVALPGAGRDYLPLTSSMIATSPIPEARWQEVGWTPGLAVSDRHHLFFYAQRTVDDRLAIGGRGAPYSWRDPFAVRKEADPAVERRLVSTVRQTFPGLGEVEVAHRWGGTLAVPRDWSMSLRYDPRSGRGIAGGYSGHGLVAAHLAGRTMADLVHGRRSPLVSHPWVGHRSRPWEPEPLRYLASRAIVGVTAGADRFEDRTNRRARRTGLVAPFLPPG